MAGVMTGVMTGPTELDARRALDAVIDPELDEPITDLGFVRSVEVTGEGVQVHLRLPTSFCSPNFAWLMASDAHDALSPLFAHVTVELDDHHDSDLINRGLAGGLGYQGTFGHEAEASLDELRLTFQRKAHTAAMERALTSLQRAAPSAWPDARMWLVTLADLPDHKEKQALIRRREAIGLGVDPGQRVLLDDAARPVAAEQSVARLRRARSVRISVDGNAHFCRGLLTTRYPGSEADQSPRTHIDSAPQAEDDGRHRTTLTLITPPPRTPERTRS